MKPEDIKVGETYYIRVKADSKDSESVYCQLIDADGNGRKALSFYNWMLYSFTPVPAAPKYDPCRKLKVGDVVRVLKINGNLPKCKWAGNIPKEGITGIVRELRKEDHFVWIDYKEMLCYCIDPAYLELVTPVEELEPYSVHESEVIQGFDIVRDKLCVVTFPFGAKESGWYYNRLAAKEAAEAECDRLNAEYRKEQEND